MNSAGSSFSIRDTQVTKGIAILLMMLHHCFSGAGRYKGYEIDFSPFTEQGMLRFSGYGKICVALFVFLTAYGMTVTYKKLWEQKKGLAKGMAACSLRRIWKLYAGYWFAYVLCIIGCWLWSPNRLSIYEQGTSVVGNVLADFFGVTVYSGTPSLVFTWWYMSLALAEILILPLLFVIYKAVKVPGLLILCVAASRLFNLGHWAGGNFNHLLVIALGIWLADKNYLGKIRDWKRGEVKWEILKFALAVDLVVLTYWIYGSGYLRKSKDLVFLFCTAAVVFLVSQFVGRIPVLREVLEFFGKYSMNVFLIHTLIRGIWLKDFLYSMGQWWKIMGALFMISLAVSVGIELVKKLIGYNRFVNWAAGDRRRIKAADKGNK